MNYKPFDLKIALEHPERVVTRDGRKVLEIKHFEKAEQSGYCVAVQIEGEKGLCAYSLTGTVYPHSSGHRNDLLITPETKEVYVNIYRNGSSNLFTGSNVFFSEAQARSVQIDDPTYVATAKATIEV